jgi:hypothetical protein
MRRGLGLDERELVARPEEPEPMHLADHRIARHSAEATAIWLALKPSAQSLFSSSTLSSFQAMVWPPHF